MLFAYQYSDGTYHFTHNAAIFSNNLNYLNYDITRLIFSYITKSKYLNEVEQLRTKTNRAAIKSAKSAIMSRNMSHNLGSHVMFYIKQKLNSVSKMLDSEVLKDLYPDTIESLSKKIDGKEFEMPFLVGIGRFINYLQERQDYIATVAQIIIPANSTISFKDFIYDELKPDLTL